MANQLVFKFISDTAALTKGINSTKKQLSGLEKLTQGVGRSMSKALGAVGVGIGLASVVYQLKEAGKAAVEDAKAQQILAASMKNSVGATDEQVSSTEDFIKKLQLQTSILDDELRPAMSTFVRATGDVAKSQELLTLATDVSAGTGKDLATVSQAIAKAYNGQFTSLNKLVPGIANAVNPIGELERKFKGLAETAANADPFTRMQVIFADLQEQIGSALIPYLQQMAEYLSSTEGQQQLQAIAQTVAEIVQGFMGMVQWIGQNIQLIVALGAAFATIRIAWIANTVAVGLYNAGMITSIALTTALKIAIASTGIGLLIVGLGSLAGAFMGSSDATDQATDSMNNYAGAVDAAGNAVTELPVANVGQDLKPINPKPGEVYTWFNYDDQHRAVWHTQTWDGKKWSKPEPMKMPVRSGGGGKPKGKSAAEIELERLKGLTEKIKDYGKKFRDAMNFSTDLSEDQKFFNVDRALNRIRGVLDAAKKVPALLQSLRSKGASPSMLQEIFSLGPIGAQATATALLESGNLAEFVSSEKQLTSLGMKAGAIVGNNTGGAAYTINVNKANMTADEIIAAITKWEKKAGRKVSFSG